MKLRHIFTSALLVASAIPAIANDFTFSGSRVDFLNKQGERISSVNWYGALPLTFTPVGQGYFEVSSMNGDLTVSPFGIRFVGFGEEDYEAQVEEVVDEVEDYGLEIIDNSGTQNSIKRIPDLNKLLTPGTSLRLYVDLPNGYHPDISIRYLFTNEFYGTDTENYLYGDFWNSYLWNPYISWFNPSLRDLGGGTTCIDEPMADEQHPNRYWISFTMPNEPILLLIGATKLDATMMDKTARMAVAFGMQRPTSINLRPAQALMQGDTGLSYYLGEIPGSDCFVNFIINEAPHWSVLYNNDEDYIYSSQYVWQKAGWDTNYAIIAAANDLLHNIDFIPAANSEEANLRHYNKGEALTMRAHAYWRLLQLYAPRWEDSDNGATPCIVMRNSLFEPRNKALSTMSEVIDQCYTDLDAAISEFKAAGKSYRQETFEPDINVAYGVYARVAALKHDWQKVREMARAARQGKRIATSEEIFNGYMKYNENEWMWAPSFGPEYNFIYANWCTFFACNGYGACNGRYTNSINIDLYRQIPEGDERRDWWMTSDKLNDTDPGDFYQADCVDPSTQEIISGALSSKAHEWLDSRKPSTCSFDAYSGYAYVLRDGAQVKFWCNGETGQNGLCQVPYMRATEMWLYEAEACAELGMTAEAQTLLNEINQPRNPSYNCTSTGRELIDEVRLYRRIELWGEGFCWFDLKRWNMPMERRAWVNWDTTSGNIPAAAACYVPPTQNNGWRYGIPKAEFVWNNLIGEPIGSIPTDMPSMIKNNEKNLYQQLPSDKMDRPMLPNLKLKY